MATTSNSYTGNGSTVLFSFTFPYLDTTDIKVSLNGVVTTAYSLANATTVQLNTAPANGVAIKIYRVTGSDQTEAEFYPGSAIRSTDLNRNFLQTLYVSQETQEVVADSSSAGLQAQITTANNTANTAISTANAANATANGIAGTANTALANSSSAVTQAGNAVTTANAASATANAFSSVATSAQTTANTAQTTANAALPKAGGTLTGDVANSSTGYFSVPIGSTAQRPGTPAAGMLRYNSDLIAFEGYGSAWAAIGGGIAGTVNWFAMNTAPTGYLKANGAAISRTTYAILFSAIGTTFGVGDGSTTFNVPDLRGEFLRGWDDSRGVDSGRAFGSAQADEFKSHTHTLALSTFGVQTGGGGSAWGNGSSNTGATGGTETRPRNIALLACIKF